MSDYSNDLVLLERVLLKLGLTDTDEQLEQQLNKFLGPVLLKIVSPSEEVRKKVMEILTHVNKRLKSRPEVKLDLVPILKHYQESSNSFLINFAIIYITLGFPRLDLAAQTVLVPVILNCLEGKPEIHQNKLLMLILPLLGDIKFPEDPKERETFLFGLSDRPNTKQQLASILLDVLLLPYGFIETEVPTGMSSYSFKRVNLENKKAEYLENMKKGIVKFLDCGVFEEARIVPHLIVASADTRFSVATPALNELNKICTSLDWFDPKMTTPLYILFSGNGSKIPDRKTSPCSTRVKQKILLHLLKCRGPAINVAKGIQVIFEGLFAGEATNQKCKVASLQFAANLICYGDSNLIEKLSKVLQTYITKLIGLETSEPVDVQNAAYNAISKLVAQCPDSFNKDVNLIVDYFQYLNAATPDLHNSIREVLVALAQAFKWDPSKMKEEPMELDDEGNVEARKFSEKFTPLSSHLLILGVLQEQTESRLPMAQNIASLFLTTCFPSYFVPARYLLLVLCGNSAQLREIIYGYLYGSQRKDHIDYSKLVSCDTVAEDADERTLITNQTIILPGFKPLINYISQIAEKKLGSASERATYSNHKLAFNLDVFTELLDYLRLCLWFSAGGTTEPGTEKEISSLSEYISTLNSTGNVEHIEKFMKLIRNVIIAKKGFVELSCLSDLLTAAPEIITKNNLDLRSTLSQSLREVNETIRMLIARIYGILLAYGEDEKSFNSEISSLANFTQKALEYQHGCVLAISHGFYHRIINFRRSENSSELAKLIASKELAHTVGYLVKLLTDVKSLLVLAAIKGISLIGCTIELPLEVSEAKESTMEVDDAHNTKNYVFKTIYALLKSSQTKQKVREDAAHCLGHLSIGDSEFFAKRVISGFLELKRTTKDAAIHIAIAQGLVFTFAGDENLPTEIQVTKDDDLLRNLISDLVKIVPEVNVCSRQAVALWLLAIVKACSARQPVLEKRKILQMAFTNLLSEDNELVQDVASRGLGLIYNLAGESERSALSALLLEQLTDGNRGKATKVTDETVVFEEGVLGKAPQGGNLSTYKELCSLASDLNQPEIIYSFMQLANNNANWNSRLGAAFGLKSISAFANLEMQPYLSKIVPRLFRYKYDPTQKIQNSMISIWDSVVKDNKATMELYYWEILEDCSSNLTHTEWRTRIACCLAIRDLIRQPNGLKLRATDPKPKASSSGEKMDVDGSVPEPELKELWMQLYRVMDDIHEGTREAAEGSAKQLAKMCVVSVSCDLGKSGVSVSSSILPFLLEIGVTHTVPEIRRLSLKTVSEMIDSSGQFIQPHLSALIPCLLKATGELDSSKLSMLSTMVSGTSGSQEVVDSIRAEAAKSHFTMETLIKCIKYIDFPILEKTTPAVLDLIKTSVILGTRIATAHFVCLISVHLSQDMTPLVGKYLSACVTALSDRNTVVRKYYASAIGHLIGNAKDTTVVSLFKKLNTLYFDDQAGKSRAMVLTLNAINKKHADIIKDYASAIMPLIFFAKHEEINEDNKASVEMWEELWSDVSFGNSMLQLYFNDIVAVLESSLNSQSWLLKAQAGSSIRSIAKRLSSNLKEEDRARLIELVLANVSGRTFSGKERLVEALAALSSKSSSKELSNRLIEAVLRECRKEEAIYKTKVLKCLGDVLETLDEENRFEDVYNMVWDLLDKKSISSKDEEPGPSSSSTSNEERNKDKNTLINLKEVVCETLGKSWPTLKAVNSVETQEKYQLMLIVKLTECLKVNTRPIQKSLMVALGLFLEKLHLLNSEAAVSEESLIKICDLVMVNVFEASVVPHTGLKKEALQAYLILIKKLKAKNKKFELDFVRTKFEGMLANFQKDSSPEIKLRLQDISEISKGF